MDPLAGPPAADIAVRGTALAAGGLAAVLADLHPQVRLIGSSVLIGVSHTADVTLDGRGLTLLPTAWGGELGAMWDPPWQPARSYPARCTSATPPTAVAPAGLARLLGRTRAAVLAALTDLATTRRH